MERIAVLIPTYLSEDCSLEETLKSVKAQTYSNYHVFLIGDKFTDSERFAEAGKIIPKDKLFSHNRSVAPEREKYEGQDLWHTGGVSASNFGLLEISEMEDLDWVAFLDHDDLWDKNHLAHIARAIDEGPKESLAFVATQGRHINGNILPRNEPTFPYFPQPQKILKSSTCINTSKIPILFEDTANLNKPADAHYWSKVSELMFENGYTGTLIKEITVTHDRENNHTD